MKRHGALICRRCSTHLLHLRLHGVDRGRRRGERLDGLTGWGQNSLVLNGDGLQLGRRHDALHLRLQDWERPGDESVELYCQHQHATKTAL